MRIAFDQSDLAFHREVCEWIDANYPADVRARIARSPHGRAERDDHVRWQQALHGRGWLVPHWPAPYGGGDWSTARLYLLRAALADRNTPDLPGSGVELLGPVLLRFGTAAQIRRHLDDLLAARTWWTQGFSEPNAGSDLASLQTRAECRGDRYVLNGSKIWTTNAHRADRMFALVRTSRGARKQDGISFLLLDMKSKGVTVRPIITLDEAPAGFHEVNEVLFEDVEVPVDECLGEEGRGWDCTRYLLEFERSRPVATAWSLKRRLHELLALGKTMPAASPAFESAAWRARYAQLAVEVEVLMWTELRMQSQQGRGQSPGVTSGSLIKTIETEIDQRIHELEVGTVGIEGLPLVQPDDPLRSGTSDAVAVTLAAYFNSRKRSIYGGTNEIQRNIIARLALKLP